MDQSVPVRFRSDARSAPRCYGAVDLGTNNCRLLVAERSRSGGLRVIDSFSQIVRLGEGLAQSGRLSDAAMSRAMEALSQVRDKLTARAPFETLCVATQACRAAENGRAFIRDVRQRLGLDLRLISPKQEAKFALLGSLDLVDATSDFALVIDIGGGSTELCWVDAGSVRKRRIKGCAQRPPILGWASFPLGVVTLAESFKPEGADWYDRMVQDVEERLRVDAAANQFGRLFAAGRGQLIGNSGTVTSLAAVHLRLGRYLRAAVDGIWLGREEARAARRRLLEATPEERAAEPCIGPGRADLILAGCAILEAVWNLWPAERLRVGDRGLREGIILSLIHAPATDGSRGRRGRGSPRQLAEPSA